MKRHRIRACLRRTGLILTGSKKIGPMRFLSGSKTNPNVKFILGFDIFEGRDPAHFARAEVSSSEGGFAWAFSHTSFVFIYFRIVVASPAGDSISLASAAPRSVVASAAAAG